MSRPGLSTAHSTKPKKKGDKDSSKKLKKAERDKRRAQSTQPGGKKRKSSSSTRSAFPSQEMSVQVMRQKMTDYETQIKSLTRDNKVLARRIEKMDNESGKKSKKIDKEKDMRLNANKERYWLRQKLNRLQMAIEARLKMLGIDFSNINDLGEALEAAFAAIQKLAAELAKKEDELAALNAKYERAQKEQEESLKSMDKLNRKIAKQKNALEDTKKALGDRDRRLSTMGKQKDDLNDKERQRQDEIDKLRKELDDLRKSKNKQFDDFVDKKAELDKAMRKKDKENKQLNDEFDDEKKKNQKLEDANAKLKNEMDKLRALLDKQNEKLMEERDKNKEGANDMEELEKELDDANARNDKLKQSNKSLNDELEKLRAMLAQRDKELEDANKTIAEQAKKIQGLEDELKDKCEEIDNLNDKVQSLEGDLEKTRASLAERDQELADEKERFAALEKEKKEQEDDMTAQMEEQKQASDLMRKKMADMERKMKEMQETIDDQDSQLSDCKSQLDAERKAKEELAKKAAADGADGDEALEAMQAEKDALRDRLEKEKKAGKEKDDELERLRKALADAEKKLADYLDRPRDDKCVQTEVTGKWIENARMQLSNLDNIFKENEELRALASKNDDRLDELVEENRQLLDEIDTLLKQQAQFRPDTSNHRGQILAMCASPGKYTVATSATDKSVRLWLIDPNEPKAKDQCKTCLRAQMEGVALSLAYTRDGTYLVAGCAYKNGPEGLLIVWNMTRGDGEVEFLFRSRPSVRFGRAHCVCWSDNSQYIFSGDTTGAIWVWDTMNQVQLAVVQAHKDVVHDIGVASNAMFSCSLDQTLCVFNLTKLSKVKIKKNKIHKHEPKHFKSQQLDRNDKYPYWLVSPTADCGLVIAGSRKLHSWKFSGFKGDGDDKKTNCSLDKGPRMTDTDLEHVQSLQVWRGMCCISRKEKNRAKVFQTSNGKELYKAKFKNPVSRIQFLHDMQRCVVMCQKQEGKKAKPPTMHLWNYKDK